MFVLFVLMLMFMRMLMHAHLAAAVSAEELERTCKLGTLQILSRS
jgi:hypothetical protein